MMEVSIKSKASIEKNRERQRHYNRRPEVKARMKEYHKEYYNKLEIKKRHSEWMKKYHSRPEIKKRHAKHMKEYYQRSEVKKSHAEWGKKYEQKPKVKERRKSYEQKLEVKERRKRYHQRPEVKKKKKEYHKERIKKDKGYSIKISLRTSFRDAMKTYSNNGKIKSSNKYGINFRKIIEYLKPFPKDRENYHIDHIIPLSWFDFNNSKEIRWAFAPENHQWLTVQENLWKSNKFLWVKQVQ